MIEQTREEIFLRAAAEGNPEGLPSPVTRKEFYLAKAAGLDVPTPEPVTRIDYYLDQLAQSGGGGGVPGGYNVTFVVMGKIYQFVSVTPGANVQEPDDPEEEGFHFDEWEIDGQSVSFPFTPDGDVTITAVMREVYTVTFVSGETVYKTESAIEGESIDEPSEPTQSGYVFLGWQDSDENYIEFPYEPIASVTFYAAWEEQTVSTVLDDNDWGTISEYSSVGSSLWSVGDTKMIQVSGKVGTLDVDTSLGVFILGFDHNSAVEGTGISFGGFKAAVENGVNVALCDSHYGQSTTDGYKWFNMNHSNNTNSGGWQGCDMRYDILGSVEAKGQQNATSAAISSPVADTLMAALPSDLRAVLKPIVKWTDNVGGGTNTPANVTATVDYLPLLAVYEVFAVRSDANAEEKNHQAQYAFYANGNSAINYKHNDTSTAVNWWTRSASCLVNIAFCSGRSDGGSLAIGAKVSYGVAPVFLV